MHALVSYYLMLARRLFPARLVLLLLLPATWTTPERQIPCLYTSNKSNNEHTLYADVNCGPFSKTSESSLKPSHTLPSAVLRPATFKQGVYADERFLDTKALRLLLRVLGTWPGGNTNIRNVSFQHSYITNEGLDLPLTDVQVRSM